MSRRGARRCSPGEKINETEGRAVLHTALRAPDDAVIRVDGQDVMPAVRATRARMETFAEGIRSGRIAGQGGPYTDVVNIGIGGSDLGPAMATLALAPYHDGPRCHFVSNVDGAHIHDTLKGLDPARTLVIVASKTFTTIETMTNAATARAWLAAVRQRPRRAMRGAVHGQRQGRRFRHRAGAGLRLRGLGGRPLFHVGADRSGADAGRRASTFPPDAGRGRRHGRAFPRGPAGTEPAGPAGPDRYLAPSGVGPCQSRGAALRSAPVAPAGLSPAARDGKQRQAGGDGWHGSVAPFRPRGLGRAGHQRAACVLSVDPSGHGCGALRIPDRGPGA